MVHDKGPPASARVPDRECRTGGASGVADCRLHIDASKRAKARILPLAEVDQNLRPAIRYLGRFSHYSRRGCFSSMRT